jgi:phage terminase Nu1 subunit (DNA packaging protein)
MASDTELSEMSDPGQHLSTAAKARLTREKNRAQELADNEALAKETGDCSHVLPSV